MKKQQSAPHRPIKTLSLKRITVRHLTVDDTVRAPEFIPELTK